MSFKTDVQSDLIDIINDTDAFGIEVTHTPQGGAPQTPFNVILGEAIKHGDDDDEAGEVNGADIYITASSDDVITISYRDNININNVDYVVVNDPYQDSVFKNVSVIQLRRLIETKI